MPTYDFICTNCDKPFEHYLTFNDFDRSKSEYGTFIVDCPN